ncbi:hypothetical protein BGX28_005995 [Mortierella sp. GBA30]|nr:hypothetical protein BGX28_005995 [Mortierella sp. GBA30]
MLDLSGLNTQHRPFEPSQSIIDSDSGSEDNNTRPQSSQRVSDNSRYIQQPFRQKDDSILSALSDIGKKLRQRKQLQTSIVLVCSSADEAEEIDADGLRSLGDVDGRRVALSCVESSFEFGRRTVIFKEDVMSRDNVETVRIVSDAPDVIPASEDEGPDTTTGRIHTEKRSKLSASPSFPNLSAQSMQLDADAGLSQLATHESELLDRSEEQTSHILSSSEGTEEHVRSSTSDLTSNLQSQRRPVKLYPLRQRTFQQRKPYTADKQQHARLIGSRNASLRSSLPDDYTREERAFLRHQDDDDDLDYEERAHPATDHDSLVEAEKTSHSKEPSRTIAQGAEMDFFLQDLDEDDLPTIEELRLQSRSQKVPELPTPDNRHPSHQFPPVKLPSALGIRAKRRLQRMVRQSVEPLEPVDARPKEKLVTYRRRPHKSRSSTPTLQEDELPLSPHASPASPPVSDVSSSDAPQIVGYGDISPPRSAMVSSDSEQLESVDEIGHHDSWRHRLSPAYDSSSRKTKIGRSAPRGERLDMIDRMIVRSSQNSHKTKKRASTSHSKKRRRLSGGSSFPKDHRTDHGSPMPSKRRTTTTTDFNGRFSSSAVFKDRGTEHGYDSALSDEIYDHDSLPVSADNRDSRDAESDIESSHGYTQAATDQDLDSEFAAEDSLPMISAHARARRMNGSRGYYMPRYDRNSPTYRPRPLCRSKVAPKPRRIGALDRSLPNRRARPDESRKRKQAPQTKITMKLQSHLTSWCHPLSAQSRPQLFNKPFFHPAKQTTSSDRPQIQTPSPSEPDNPPDDYDIHDIPWEHQDDYEPAHLHSSPEASTPVPALPPARPSSSAMFKMVNHGTLRPDYRPSDEVISNRLYFSQDTYIGRGMLSRLLCFLSEGSTVNILDSESRTSVVLFGKPFTSEWSNPARLEMDLGGVALEFRRRFLFIQEAAQGVDADNHGDRTELTPLLRALENLTLLLMERMRMSSGPARVMLWNVFQHQLVNPIKALADASKGHSSLSSIVMWMLWAIVAWNAIADCTLASDVGDMDATDQAAQSLLERLVTGSDKAFFAQIARIQDYGRRSSGMISGQDVTELWVCVIQILSRREDIWGSLGFWASLNRVVCRTWVKLGTGDNLPTSQVSLTRADEAIILMQELCRLHQFGQGGSSDASIRVNENWELVLWLLQNSWLDGTVPRSQEAERQVRRLLTFCHSRFHIWHWTPNPQVIVQIYRYFASQGFRDMPSERGYRLPEFLKRMISRPSSTSKRPSNPNETRLETLATFDPNMALVESIDKYDRCFEIFLKILAKMIHWQVSTICVESEIDDGIGTHTPNATAISQADVLEGATPLHQAASRTDKIKVCKRLLSSISPALVTTISPDGSGEQSYSSLCNPCNLVLIVALLVPDFIRPSTVGQLRSLLNYEQSDDASRRILLESVFYLGVIWERQGRHIGVTSRNMRSMDKILDFFFGRMETMCREMESDMSVMNESTSYVLRSKRQAPIAALIETTIGYITRLLNSSGDTAVVPEQLPVYPALEYLDQRKCDCNRESSRKALAIRKLDILRSICEIGLSL